MTPEKELTQYRQNEKLRPRRAKTTKIVFAALLGIAVVAFVYAFYIQNVGMNNWKAYQVELQKMHETLTAAEQKAAKFEEMAERETNNADSLAALCAKKPNKSK